MSDSETDDDEHIAIKRFLKSDKFSQIVDLSVQKSTNHLSHKLNKLEEEVNYFSIGVSVKLSTVLEHLDGILHTVDDLCKKIPSEKKLYVDQHTQTNFALETEDKMTRSPVTSDEIKRKATYFQGVARNLWLYVSRCSPGTTEACVMKFLKDKCPGKDFIVEQVGGGSYPSFKVGAPFDLKDEMYSDKFWPNHVVVKRFHFLPSNIPYRQYHHTPLGRNYNPFQPRSLMRRYNSGLF